MELVEQIIKQFGPVLTLEDVAAVFKCSPAALRQALRRNDGLGGALRRVRSRRGRRLYFAATDVARVFQEGQEGAAQ